MNEAYVHGFMTKCAEHGVDPEVLIKSTETLAALEKRGVNPARLLNSLKGLQRGTGKAVSRGARKGVSLIDRLHYLLNPPLPQTRFGREVLGLDPALGASWYPKWRGKSVRGLETLQGPLGRIGRTRDYERLGRKTLGIGAGAGTAGLLGAHGLKQLQD